MKRVKISIIVVLMMMTVFTISSSAKTSAEEEYYSKIIEKIALLDGEYDLSSYKLVTLQSPIEAKTKVMDEKEMSPNAVQVSTQMGDEICVDTFFPYTYDEEGNFVNALRRYSYDKNCSYTDVFDGATVKCRTKYKYFSDGANYYFYPREFGVVWLGGGSVYSIDAHLFARGVLLDEDHLESPINSNYVEQLDVYRSNPDVNVEYIDTANPYNQVIGIWEYYDDGGFISLTVNGIEEQYTVIDKIGPK